MDNETFPAQIESDGTVTILPRMEQIPNAAGGFDVICHMPNISAIRQVVAQAAQLKAQNIKEVAFDGIGNLQQI